ncbi:MAG: hypothetical protein JWP15_3354 [Alphaproteobacteria bacterium]|nr:hypothetical protein [Alphaproteobacteria bacterium]
MEKNQSVDGYTLLLVASLARDLDSAGLLSRASRLLVHGGLAEIRGELDAIPGAGPAVTILETIAPAGSD